MVYETMPGWKEDISKVTRYISEVSTIYDCLLDGNVATGNVIRFQDLPVNCQRYIIRLEELTGVPVKWIGVGPGRDDVITK